MSEWAVILGLPAAIAAAVIVLVGGTRLGSAFVDRPNARSLHEVPTPRIGGLGVMAGAIPVAAWFADLPLGVALACALALALVSALDDWRGLPVAVRLSAHVVAATVAVLAIAAPQAGSPAPGTWGALGAVLAIVWTCNLYNFMDGADTLAGLMTAIGFGALAFAALQSGAMPLAISAAAIASAAAGFLAFNVPPASVFLGDAGSVPLGFLAAVLGGYGALSGAWPLWFPVLVFSPFLVDATVTIAKRAARRERVWIAHRDHYYQRLVLSGWPPRRLALAAATLMLAVSASAVAALPEGEMLRCGILALWSVAYAVLIAVAEVMIPKKKNGQGAQRSNRASREEP